MIESLFSTIVEILLIGTGRRVLKFFGARDSGDIASFLAGLSCWILIALTILVLVQ
jgi:hypothetical protein